MAVILPLQSRCHGTSCPFSGDANLEVKILDMNSQNLLVFLTFIEVSWGLEGY